MTIQLGKIFCGETTCFNTTFSLVSAVINVVLIAPVLNPFSEAFSFQAIGSNIRFFTFKVFMVAF